MVLLSIEEQRMVSVQEGVALRANVEIERLQLLNHVAENQRMLEDQIVNAHKEQEKCRQKLSQDMSQAEAELGKSINGILQEAALRRDPARLGELILQEEILMKNLLALRLEEYQSLRKVDVLSAMENQFEDSLASHRSSAKKLMMNSLVDDHFNDEDIKEALEHKGKDKKELINRLTNEEMWQRHAFASLLAQRDTSTQQLVNDIETVVKKLNQLTEWELSKSEQRAVSIEVMQQSRLQLADLLAHLMYEQKQRKEDLNRLLIEMEEQRQSQAQDYWLMQYQRLMESAPPDMAALVKCENAQATPQPSSTPELDIFPSAHAAQEVFSETCCVVCLDGACRVVFLPCGHLSCCTKCADGIVSCPMCRGNVKQRLLLHF